MSTTQRNIKWLVVHCAACPQSTSVKSIVNYWKNALGWKSPGYHVLVEPDGTPNELLPITEISNGVKGFNANSIHISYIGGVDKDGKAIDNRTPEQKATILKYLRKWKATCLYWQL